MKIEVSSCQVQNSHSSSTTTSKWKKWDPLFWSSICRLFFHLNFNITMKNKKNWIHCFVKKSEKCILSLSNCCINTNQVTQITIAQIDSPVCLLFKNVYFVWHCMNGLCFICPFVDITAKSKLILKKTETSATVNYLWYRLLTAAI